MDLKASWFRILAEFHLREMSYFLVPTASCRQVTKKHLYCLLYYCFRNNCMSVIEMPSCCVAYCQSDSRCNDNLISLFGVPKDQALFEEWAKVIPIKRKPLNPKSLVCQLHFEETCIKNSNKKKKSPIENWFHSDTSFYT